MNTICYWIIGRDTEQPALAWDVHNEQGDIVTPTQTKPLAHHHETTRARLMHNAAAVIAAIAQRDRAAIAFDADTTEHCRND